MDVLQDYWFWVPPPKKKKIIFGSVLWKHDEWKEETAFAMALCHVSIDDAIRVVISLSIVFVPTKAYNCQNMSVF